MSRHGWRQQRASCPAASAASQNVIDAIAEPAAQKELCASMKRHEKLALKGRGEGVDVWLA